MKRGKSFATTCFAVELLLCLATACGCASPVPQGEPANSPAANGGVTEVEQLPTQEEYELPDPANRGRVRVQVPKGYECSEHLEDVEPYTGKALMLEAMTVDLGEQGSLRILVDDVGFLDWWYGGSTYGTASAAEYVDAAKDEGSNSSWPISVGGHDSIVLITGSATEGGEVAGDVFVFLDEATISISAILPSGETPAADAYSMFFRSEEVEQVLAGLTISSE